MWKTAKKLSLWNGKKHRKSIICIISNIHKYNVNKYSELIAFTKSQNLKKKKKKWILIESSKVMNVDLYTVLIQNEIYNSKEQSKLFKQKWRKNSSHIKSWGNIYKYVCKNNILVMYTGVKLLNILPFFKN